MPLTPDEAGDLYARWVWRTGLGDATKGVYEQRVRSFLAWLIEQGEQYADALTNEDVRDYASRDYRRKLLTVDKRAPSTVAQHIAALGSFFEWAELGKPRNVSVEVPPSQKKGLTEDELRKVLRACQRRGPRDFAIAQVLFQSGVRVDECVHLDTDDLLITERTGQLVVRYGKGGKPRTLPLSAQARDALRDWLEARREVKGADTPPLFLSTRGERLAVRSVQDVMSKAGQAAGVKVTPHVLRHTFGRRSVEAGTDLEALRQLMGHKSIQTTAGYTRPRWENLEEAVERVGIDL
jgi:integrase/recombinase XerC